MIYHWDESTRPRRSYGITSSSHGLLLASLRDWISGWAFFVNFRRQSYSVLVSLYQVVSHYTGNPILKIDHVLSIALRLKVWFDYEMYYSVTFSKKCPALLHLYSAESEQANKGDPEVGFQNRYDGWLSEVSEERTWSWVFYASHWKEGLDQTLKGMPKGHSCISRLNTTFLPPMNWLPADRTTYSPMS